MTSRGRKHGIFAVPSTESAKVKVRIEKCEERLTIETALKTIFQQMRAAGNRARTIESYDYIFRQFIEVTNLRFVYEIKLESLYDYLAKIEVANETKLIRLKSIKAVLNRFYNNGWIQAKFWTVVQIKIDKKVKQGADERDIEKLIELIDKTNFIGYRDATAILTMYKTGIRIKTLGELQERHIDFENLNLNLDGVTMKNHKFLKLPIDEELADMLKNLTHLNKGIREYYNTDNTNLFITQNGLQMNTSKSSNCAISKQLHRYSKTYGFKNINPHSIRRAYAKNLLKKGASVALISKALGHSNLEVTTQYLDLDIDEVADNLRDLL